jgi:single-stranded DNA-binding protein
MATFNSFTIAGRLGKDSTSLTSKSGTDYVRLSVATEPGLGEGPLWVDVVIYGGLGEAVRKLELRAGDLVLVAGRLNLPRVYQDKATTQMVADELRLLARKRAPEPATEAADAF